MTGKLSYPPTLLVEGRSNGEKGPKPDPASRRGGLRAFDGLQLLVKSRIQVKLGWNGGL